MAKRRSKTPARSRTSHAPRTSSAPRRASHAPRAPKSDNVVPFLLIGVGAIAIGGAIWMGARRAQAAQMPPPSPMPNTGGTQPPTTQLPSQPAAPTTSTNNGVTTHTADAMTRIASRLRTNATARQIYAFQALLYSYAFTDALPDGVIGPVTTALIRSVQQLVGVPQTGTFAPVLIEMAQSAMAAWPQNPGTLRVVPDRLPADVLNLVNSTLRQYAPTAPLLQMYAA